jgi:hypothetical protein
MEADAPRQRYCTLHRICSATANSRLHGLFPVQVASKQRTMDAGAG